MFSIKKSNLSVYKCFLAWDKKISMTKTFIYNEVFVSQLKWKKNHTSNLIEKLTSCITDTQKIEVT